MKQKDWHITVYKKKSDEWDEYFKSPEWIKLRRDCFKRDNYTCIRCDNRNRVNDLQAHHVIPRDEGGANSLSNLVTICNDCHDIVEIENHRSIAAIIGSLEAEDRPVIGAPVKLGNMDDGIERPEWHKWVYGGMRGPRPVTVTAYVTAPRANEDG